MAITDAQRQQVIQAVQDGAGCREIAGQVGISTGSVRKIIRDAGITPDWARPESAGKKDPASIRAKLAADLLADAAFYRRLAREYASRDDMAKAKAATVCLGITADKLIMLEKPDPADDPAVGAWLALLAELDKRDS